MTDTLKMAREALAAALSDLLRNDGTRRSIPAVNSAIAAIDAQSTRSADMSKSGAAIDAQAPQAAPVGWLRAIDEALVTSHIDVASADDTYDVAKEKLNRLLAHEQSIGAYFATPPQQAAPVALTPLTQDTVLDMAEGVSLQFHDLLAFARAIERAHGIGAAAQGGEHG